tara:strand:- start:702 stop:1682 length:981 start_codon:yes stop_codon:yes gene_type:complete
MASLMTKQFSVGTALVDTSGSMSNILNGLVTGLKELIQDRQKQATDKNMETSFRLATFDSVAKQILPKIADEKVVYGTDFMNISDVDSNAIALQADGATRLVDTALYEINLLIEKKKQIEMDNDDLMEMHNLEITAWFFLLTDGDDNMSHQPARKLHEAIEIAKSKHNIQCIFLGANQDAIKTGARFGFNTDQSLTFGGEAGDDPDLPMPVLSAMRCVSQNLTQMEENDANTVPAFTHLQRHSSAPHRMENNLDATSYPPMTEHGRLPMLRRANAQVLDDIDEYDLAPPQGLTRAVAQVLNNDDDDDVDDGFTLTAPMLQRTYTNQ